MPLPPIMVDSEYGDLKEVILGNGVWKFVDFDKAAWAEKALNVLPSEEQATQIVNKRKDSRSLRRQSYNNASEFEPTTMEELLEKEKDEVVKVLNKFGVKIYRPTQVTDDQVARNRGESWLAHGYESVFARDNFFVVGNNVIDLQLGGPNRLAGQLAYNEIRRTRVWGAANSSYINMPAADTTPMLRPGYNKEDMPVLEGGDLMVLNKTHVLAGRTLNKATGSSAQGIKWLQQYFDATGQDIKVVQVDLQDWALHLDVCMSFPGRSQTNGKLMVMYAKDCFPGSKAPKEVEGYETLHLEKEHAQHLSINGLPINPTNFIQGYSDNFPGHEITNWLEANGITAHRVYYGTHTPLGGAIRCSTHPLNRLPVPAK